MMKLVYVAGPFRGPTPWAVEQNIRAAETWAYLIWGLQLTAVCPHAMGRFFDKSIPDAVILAGTLEIMKRCDAVFLIPGWERSLGSQAEAAMAKSMNIPIFESLGELKAWRDFPFSPPVTRG